MRAMHVRSFFVVALVAVTAVPGCAATDALRPDWRAASCHGAPVGALRAGVAGSFGGVDPVDRERTPILWMDADCVGSRCATRALTVLRGDPAQPVALTARDARALGLAPDWNLVGYESGCGAPAGSDAPVTKLARLDHTAAFPARLGDLVHAQLESHLGAVRAALPPASTIPSFEDATRRDVDASVSAIRGDGAWLPREITIVTQVQVRFFAQGAACPPGADNPVWRLAFGFVGGTLATRACTYPAAGGAPACSDGPTVELPRPACPPVP